ncbi:hypothetical protein ACHAXT_008096 [Thalassiosira profunda]
MALHPSVVAAAFLSTGLISLAPNVLLFLFPKLQHNDRSGRAVLSLGQALAVGGLVGDVFLHTLPDCFADALHHDNHHDGHHHGGGGEEIGLRVIAGLAVFLILDIVVRSLEEKSGGGHSHSHGNSDDTRSQKKEGKRGANEKAEESQKPWRCLLSSAVLLNLLGDSLHNFTDGIAIGATFAMCWKRMLGAWMRLLQIGCFSLGVGFMYAVAVIEDMEHSHSDGHGRSASHNEL